MSVNSNVDACSADALGLERLAVGGVELAAICPIVPDVVELIGSGAGNADSHTRHNVGSANLVAPWDSSQACASLGIERNHGGSAE